MKHPHLAQRPLTHLPASLKRSAAVLGAILAASFLAGCERTRHHHNPGPVQPQPQRFVELEPNDSPDFPDFVGILDLSSFLVVEGFVEAVGIDIVDHIEFETNGPLEIDFTLTALEAFGDVDVTIYDPIADLIVATYAVDGRFESGTIIVDQGGRPFQFIIEAFNQDASWDLELITYPHDCFCRTAGLDSDEMESLDGEEAPKVSPIRGLQKGDVVREGAKARPQS